MPYPTLTELEEKYFIPAFGGPRYSGDVVVIPHVDGEAYFGAIADALDKCQGPDDKIYIASWVFSPDFDLRSPSGTSGPGPALGKILADKASLGADVRVIIGTPLFSTGTEGNSPLDMIWWVNGAIEYVGEAIRNVVDNNIYEARRLRNSVRGSSHPLAGRVLMDWSGTDWDSRHEKSTIIYSESTKELRAFVGGIDFDPDRISNPQHATTPSWHDAGVELYGSAAESVLDNFITRWIETATLPKCRYMFGGVVEEFNPTIETTPPTQPTHATHPAPAGGPSVTVLRSYESIRAFSPWWTVQNLPWQTLPAAPIRENLDVLRQVISSAQRYVYIEDQTLNPIGAAQIAYNKHAALYPDISTACARGVKVIFVCYDAITGTTSPTMSPEITERILNPLTPAQRDNFALFWLAGNRLHSKLVIVDDEFVSIGSANFWDRSMYGKESEINAAFVHTGSSNSMAADLRIRLWLEHLRVAPGDTPTAEAELRNLDKGLGVFRLSWATSDVSFSYPASVVREIPP